jgi:hypothetical protein
MAAFATAEDLATYMQRDFIAAETATATQALDVASEIIRGYTGQQIDEVPDESVTLRAEIGNNGVLFLSQLPVTAVASVTEDGTLLTVTTDYEWSRAGILWRVGAVNWIHPVVVVYDHGYATVPHDIKGVALSLATRLFSGTTVKSESVGMYQVTYADPDGFTPTEKAILARYRA